ncbi:MULTISPECIES: metallophosphoesterase family protein [Novosphingobium]|jgi:predicted phosphodiesterase|uniref:metallophosphoesterase family protein n=1 Tax=Novosphingobium TaxID=165696 RepID=UPI0022F273EC|nr:metallophosphoesterase family protein [Novosphingobium resinovorum]GLK46562.1 DNA methylase [Novosphingobium resinovorum]
MAIAVISDIHGNLGALDAVLADAAARGVRRVVNLGDILSGPLDSVGTADRLMALGLETIRGNHERQLLEQSRAEMSLSDAATDAVLQPRHREWLASLPVDMWLESDLYACHGSPRGDLEFLLETVEPTGCRAATPNEIAERLGGIDAPLVLCGHSHRQRAVRLDDGRLVVNPGSVGLPAFADDQPHPHVIESGSPEARYAVVERGPDGWEAELLAVAYDWTAAALRAAEGGREDWARALATGYA